MDMKGLMADISALSVKMRLLKARYSKAKDLTDRQILELELFRDVGKDLSLASLSQRLKIGSQSTLAGDIKALRLQGYIERKIKQDDTDGRTHYFVLTDAGKSYVDFLREQRNRTYAPLAKAIATEDEALVVYTVVKRATAEVNKELDKFDKMAEAEVA